MPISAITSRLFLGSITDACALRTHNPHLITTVVTMCAADPKLPKDRFTTIHLPIEDGDPVPPMVLDRALAAIWEGVKEGSVLVHCMAGMSRSPAIVAAYLHRCGFLEFDEAVQFIKKARPLVVDIAPKIVTSIKYNMRIFPYDGSLGKPYSGKAN